MKITVSVDKDLLDEAKRITRINCTKDDFGARWVARINPAVRSLSRFG